ncbi:formate--tetrahydrofolate ligase, partial [bacterium]|nr:formate--tetrahydrofolate ligase [bacterium]
RSGSNRPGTQRDLGREDLAALERGLVNLERHYRNITGEYGLPCVVSMNQFTADTPAEFALLKDKLAACFMAFVSDVDADAVASGTELLDTLAVRFCEEGWSIKRLVKEIVTSSTWRMSGRRDPRAIETDPLNLLLHHAPLRRLEGEAIRDKILAVSGRLDRTVGGPSVEVFITPFHDGRGKPASGPLDGAGRRSIYTKIRRNFLPSFLMAFDMPVPFQAMGRRNVTNVPAQALALMNDPFVTSQAVAWAKKTLVQASRPTEARIDGMYREAFARAPTADERTAALEFLAAQAVRHGVSFLDQPTHEATWADFAHALINTKEFIFVP